MTDNLRERIARTLYDHAHTLWQKKHHSDMFLKWEEYPDRDSYYARADAILAEMRKDVEPVAWVYRTVHGEVAYFSETRNDMLAANLAPDGEWIETPLYPDPPVDDRETTTSGVDDHREICQSCDGTGVDLYDGTARDCKVCAGRGHVTAHLQPDQQDELLGFLGPIVSWLRRLRLSDFGIARTFPFYLDTTSADASTTGGAKDRENPVARPSEDELVEALVKAADAMVEFHNYPTERKRPDVFQLRMNALGRALAAYREKRNG